MYYIGVDLGTSSVKLLLMDKQGTVVKTVSKEYPIRFQSPAGQNRIRMTGMNSRLRESVN